MQSEYTNLSELAGDENRLFTEKQASEFLQCRPQTLSGWRIKGDGPPYVKIGGRYVRYRYCDLMEWIKQGLRHSTSDKGGRSQE